MRTRWAVLQQIEHSRAHSSRGACLLSGSTKRVHCQASSLVSASRPIVLRENVRPQPPHSHLWASSPSLPLRTTWAWPHLGHDDGSPPGQAMASTTITFSLSTRILSSHAVS